MAKPNCWDVLGCGREEGGPRISEFGVCPAATARALDGAHGGRNGGRACWSVGGTFCEGRIQGAFAEKAVDCLACGFYRSVRADEGDGFIPSPALLRRLGDPTM